MSRPLHPTNSAEVEPISLEVSTARRALVRRIRGQWVIGLAVFAILCGASLSGERAELERLHISAWRGMKAWVPTLDSGVG
jgi:hypothetical protein